MKGKKNETGEADKIIRIFDTTLRDGEQSPGCSMDLNEKLEVARLLEKLKVDVIEAGFAVASKGDFDSVKAIAAEVKDCSVASLARALEKDIDAAYGAVKASAHPMIHTFIATSPIHMEYKLKMTPEQVVKHTEEAVKYAVKYCSNVEFSCEDATRSDRNFLVSVIQAAIKAGAKVINIPDTVGYAAPEEMHELIMFLKNSVPDIDKVCVSVHCHNDLGMAVANSLAAVRAGATQVECTINGIGERAGNAALEEVVMAINTRRHFFGAVTNIETTRLYRASKTVSRIVGNQVAPNKAIVGRNAFAHEAGIHQHGVLAHRSTYEIMTPESVGIMSSGAIVLGKHSGRHGFANKLESMGYSMSGEEIDEAFSVFIALCDKKKEVTDADIDAIVQTKAQAAHDTYKLKNFVVNSGNSIVSTAIISLSYDRPKTVTKEGDADVMEEMVVEEIAKGDGPVDAAFKAIDKMLEWDISLDDYIIRSVSEGQDALGEVMVKVSSGGKRATGRAVSTDIIESSILAYINAINKLCVMSGE